MYERHAHVAGRPSDDHGRSFGPGDADALRACRAGREQEKHEYQQKMGSAHNRPTGGLFRIRPRLVLTGRRCAAAYTGPRVRLAFGIGNLADSGPVSGFALLLLLDFRFGLGVDASTPRQVGGELSVGRRRQRGNHERQNGVSQHRYPPVAFPLPTLTASGEGREGEGPELTPRSNDRKTHHNTVLPAVGANVVVAPTAQCCDSVRLAEVNLRTAEAATETILSMMWSQKSAILRRHLRP